MAKSKHYTPNSKMAELLSEHYKVLLLIFRFEIPLGMGEKTIKEVCEAYDVDVETFLFIVHFLLFNEGKGHANLHERLSLPLLIKFLKNSHSYFLDYRLPRIGEKLMEAIEEAPQDITYVITTYFDEYVEEVRQHMYYENDVVFPYVEKLLNGVADRSYNIQVFEQRHEQIELKMLELKNIFIKYYSMETNFKLNNVLHELFACGEELHDHNAVEDDIFIPCVEALEAKLS